MDYFFDKVLPCQDGVIFLGFPDGKIGKGVYEEAERILARTGIAWELTIDGLVLKISRMNPELCLSVDETRARVYLNRQKRVMRPYEDAI